MTDVAAQARQLAVDSESSNGHRQLSSLSSHSSLAPTLGDAALIGPIGDYVRAVRDHTEADPAGILAICLAGVGTMLGRSVYVVSGERHYANLFVAPVGATAMARKGTAIGVAGRLLAAAGPEFDEHDKRSRIRNGFGSGEAMVRMVSQRDDEIVDPRLLVVEHEFARVLKSMDRKGAVLSEVIRDAFDGRTLRREVVDEGRSYVATGAHVGIVAAITQTELAALATEVDQANGLLNRFMFIAVRRQRSLPRVAPLSDAAFRPIADRVYDAVVTARLRGDKEPLEVGFSEAGGDAYDAAYAGFADDDPPGPLGAIIARGQEHMTRMALIYAVLDKAPLIEERHVEAAMAVWRYARDTAATMWSSTGDRIADRILAAARRIEGGVDRSTIRNRIVGSNNVPASDIDRAVKLLDDSGLAEEVKVETGGRPATYVVARGR